MSNIKVGDRVMIELTDRINDPNRNETYRELSRQWHGAIAVIYATKGDMAYMDLEERVLGKKRAQFRLENLVKLCNR